MAERFDVAARLTEGRPALEHTQTYVRACQALGYQQPDLTAHPSQVGDWYEAEAGLDLRVLDADAAELRAAVTAIEEALWVQRTQVTELAAAWRGSGAESASRFLTRHCDAAAEVVAHVRAAAEQCATLRDDAWQAVDGKVATTVAIDERRVAEHSVWLAAAHAVTAGTGDRSAAEAVIHRQVMPYVDNDIRNDWLAAMSSANASLAAAYDTAIHSLASTREVSFDIPGDLGPSRQPAVEEHPAVDATPSMPAPAIPLPTVPAAASALPPTPETPQTFPATRPEDEASMSATPFGDPSGLSTGAGGLGGPGGATGGIGGVLGSIVDGIGSLLGSLAGGLGGGPGLGDDPVDLGGVDDSDDDPLADDVDKPDDKTDDEEPAGPDEDVVPAAPAGESPPSPAEAVVEPTEAVAEPIAQPVEPPPDAPPPGGQSAPSAEPADGSTPCEIAEDQLPQVGQ